MSDKQLTSKLQLAQKSSHLTLSSMNLFKVPEKVFSITNLFRLDLSHNNIETISPEIAKLVKLKQLWLNRNPLREVPQELAKCENLESLDLSCTRVSTLPREIALLHKLLEINLNHCPLNEKLDERYRIGITEVWKYLQRKVDRKNYKEEVFRRLRESIYVGEDPKVIMELTLSIFRSLREVETSTLKLFVHNLNRIFPEKIEYAFPDRIHEKIKEIMRDLDRRAELSELTLKLKSRYPQVDLSELAHLALTLSQTFTKEEVGTIFVRKLLPDDFTEMELPAITMGLTQIREKDEHEMDRAKLAVFSKFKSVYGESQNIEDLQNCAEAFSELFENFNEMRSFIRNSDKYLPLEFKDFDAEKLISDFRNSNTLG